MDDVDVGVNVGAGCAAAALFCRIVNQNRQNQALLQGLGIAGGLRNGVRVVAVGSEFQGLVG